MQVLHSAFTVTQFTVGQTVQPNATLNPIVLRFDAAQAQEDLFSTELVLATNGFSYSIPLHVYHGKLQYALDDRFLHSQPNISVTVDAEGNLLPPPKDELADQVRHINQPLYNPLRPLPFAFLSYPSQGLPFAAEATRGWRAVTAANHSLRTWLQDTTHSRSHTPRATHNMN